MTSLTAISTLLGFLAWLGSQDQAAALLVDDCPTDACICQSHSVHCSKQNLTAVPGFRQTGTRFYSLELADNAITYVGASAFASVSATILDLSNNPIGSFHDDAFLGLEDILEDLELNNCTLVSLPASIGNLRRLKTLNIRHNPALTALPSSVMTSIGISLENIDFSNTGISTWPAALSSSIRLKNLRASGNKIAHIPNDAFLTFAGSLQTLDISYNQLTGFPDAIDELRSVKTIDLSFNNLVTIPPGKFTNCRYTLSTLYLVHVFFREIPHGFQDLAAIKNLYLSYNPINTARDDVFHGLISNSLQVLHLDHTLLATVPKALNSLTALQELNVTNNRLSTVDNFAFSGLHNLEVLYLDNNPISSVKTAGFSGLSKLKKLYIRNTPLSYVPNSAFSYTPDSTPSVASVLQVLDLSNNKITQLFEYGFPGMTSLQEVTLSGNPLSNVSTNAFEDLTNVQMLNFERCHLTSIPQAVRVMPRLRRIRLEGNNIECSCQNLAWVEKWRETAGLIAQIDGHCASSTRFIQDFVDTDARLCP